MNLERGLILKTKIRDRISDIRRHLLALRVGMAEFGDDFDLDAFQTAYVSEDPAELNRVKAVERGVDQLYNYIAELAALGLELAEVRTRGQETNARLDLEALWRIGVLGPERTRRLQRLRELRRLLVHEYAAATAEQVHEAARIIARPSQPRRHEHGHGPPGAPQELRPRSLGRRWPANRLRLGSGRHYRLTSSRNIAPRG